MTSNTVAAERVSKTQNQWLPVREELPLPMTAKNRKRKKVAGPDL